jgi:hypothetical protein
MRPSCAWLPLEVTHQRASGGTDRCGNDDAAVGDANGFPQVPSFRRRTWIGLSPTERRAALHAARRGQAHPDPAVARAARDWAQEVLNSRPGRLRSLVFSFVEDPWGGTLGAKLGERRAAR